MINYGKQNLLRSHWHCWQAVFCQVQSIGLTILSQTNKRAISLDGEPGLLLTAALCSKPVHWAGGLSGWVTSDSRNVLSGLSTAGLPVWCRWSSRTESQWDFETLKGWKYQKLWLVKLYGTIRGHIGNKQTIKVVSLKNSCPRAAL